MFKKTITAAAVLTFTSFLSVASAQDALDLNVVPSGAGALVQVTLDNKAVTGAVVTTNLNNGEHITDSDGKVYVSIRSIEAKPVLFNVADDQGNHASTTQFITKNHR